jgi:hypothetical protein
MRKISFTLIAITGIAISLNTKAQIIGTVFRDYNGNGTRQNTSPTNEPGVSGVIVKAYNAADLAIATTTSVAGGAYTLTGLGVSTAYRLEFTFASGSCNPSTGIDFSSYSSAASTTAVQFINTPATGTVTADFAINNPAEYATNSNPFIATSIYTNGNLTAAAAGDAGNLRDAIKITYNSVKAVTTTPGNTQIAQHKDMGSVWGVAYSPQAARVFYAAVLKRHAGMGPNGSGAIYFSNPSTTTGATLFADLDALGFATRASGTYAFQSGQPLYGGAAGKSTTNALDFGNTGNGVIGTNAERGIQNATIAYPNAGFNYDSYDAAAIAQVGKVGLGGLDISDDGKYVFVMNLFDRKLYRITIDNPASITTVTLASKVTAFTLPDPGYVGGTYRPWAVKYYRGKVYVGMVNDLNSTSLLAGTASIPDGSESTVPKYSNAGGSVYTLDNPATTGTGTFTLLTTVPLNYAKLEVAGEINTFNDFAASTAADGINENHVFRYNPWNDGYTNFKQDCRDNNMKLCFPQPIISDFEFDGQNNALVIGVLDRLGLQVNYRTWSPADNGPDDGALGTTALANGCAELASGDIIKLTLNTSCAVTNQQPSSTNAEFYIGDTWRGNGLLANAVFHGENSGGGLALLVNSGEVLTNAFDPSTTVNSGGIRAISNTTGDVFNNGATIFGANIYDLNTRGITSAKGIGMGDIELLRELAPLEIGNRIWNDANANGIQDAGETTKGGVEVELVLGGTVIATCTTNSAGNYLFISGGSATTGTGAVTCNLLPNTNYIIRIKGTVSGNTVTGNAGLTATDFLTKPNITGNGQADWSDNDGVLTGSTYGVSITTGDYGQNDHSIDFGFAPVNILPVQRLEVTAVLSNGMVTINWQTENELNTKRFYAEQSTDGRSFANVGDVAAVGTFPGIKNYSLLHDITSINGVPVIYYRIKLVDLDGKISYSNVVAVRIANINGVKTWPNPVKDYVAISLYSAVNTNMQVRITNMEGKTIRVNNYRITRGNNQLSLSGLQRIAGGVYLLELKDNTGSIRFTQKMVKE